MTNIDAAQYVAEWASKTGKNPSEIYVPLALREDETATPAEVDDDADTVVLTGRRGDKSYRVSLDNVRRSPGSVSGTVTGIEEVPSP